MRITARHIITRPLVIVGLLLTLLVSAGCEEDVTAILGTEYPYSLYGVFTPGPDTQWVRVFEVRDRLELTKPEPLDAQFVSMNLGTGETIVWQDSVTQDERGQFSHVFWAPFAVDYDEAYRIEVTRSDGQQSHVEVRIPPASTLVELEPSTTFRQVSQPVLVEGATDRLIRIELSYDITYAPGGGGDTDLGVTVSYDGKQRMTDDGWVVDVGLSDDIQLLREELARTGNWFPSFGVALNSLSLRLMVVDDAWNPPDGTFDPNVLVQPGTLSNVVNGFGFVGAGYRLERIWRPPGDVLVQAGFRSEDDGNEEEEEEERPGG